METDAPPHCHCGRELQWNFKTGKYWTRCAPCRESRAAQPGQQSPARRLKHADPDPDGAIAAQKERARVARANAGVDE